MFVIAFLEDVCLYWFYLLSPALQVNLPAHLVIVKSTMHYVGGMFQEYSESQILQMIGRAGRPQVCVCVCVCVCVDTYCHIIVLDLFVMFSLTVLLLQSS